MVIQLFLLDNFGLVLYLRFFFFLLLQQQQQMRYRELEQNLRETKYSFLMRRLKEVRYFSF